VAIVVLMLLFIYRFLMLERGGASALALDEWVSVLGFLWQLIGVFSDVNRWVFLSYSIRLDRSPGS